MPTTKGITAGFNRIQYAFGEDGLPALYSTQSTNAKSGTTRLFTAQAAAVTMPEGTTVSVTGDDGVDGQFQFEASELEAFTMSVGRQNFDFINAFQGTSSVDLQSTYSMLLRNPSGRDFQTMFLVFTRRSQERQSGTNGKYHHVIIPAADVTYTGSEFNFQEAGSFSFSVTASKVERTFWGNALGADTNEVGGKNAASSFELFTEYPIAIDVFTENAIATSFTPTQTPRSGGTVVSWTWDGSGVPATGDAAESSGDISFTAGTSGEHLIVLYEVAE